MRRFTKRRPQRGDGLEITVEKFSAGSPTKEKVSSGSELIDYKAFRDLAFSGAIEPHADPNTEAAKGSYPYAILNRTNRVVEANYPGYKNISGNSIVRLQNSVSSQFLNLFDSVVMEKRLNYLYAAYESDQLNVPFNVEMQKAFDQALSYGYSTMLTQLPFYTDYVETNLPRVGSLVGHKNDTYDRMGALLHYQTVLQNSVSPLAKYVELRSVEGQLMNMSYRREAPIIQQVFGQLKKKAFIAQLNATGTVVLGEYFDKNWWMQTNALRHIPSRRSDDMNNPIITMVTTHKIPKLVMKPNADAAAYYDSDTDLIYPGDMALLDPEDYIIKNFNNINLEKVVLNINKLLDPHYLLCWARKRTSGTLPAGAITAASKYYQSIVDYVNILSYICARFGANMTEIRTFLDKLSDTGMVYWTKGVKFNIAIVNEKPITYNQVMADVLKATLAGAYDITFDANTLRWSAQTEWNMYTGISKFDDYSGGSFLTFGLRNINGTDSAGDLINKTSSTFLIPVLFDAHLIQTYETTHNGNTECGVRACTRLGFRTALDYHYIDNATLTGSSMLSRLNPLSDSRLSIKAPDWNRNSFNYAALSNTERAHIVSALHKLLVQTCGYDRISVTNTSIDSALDPDILAFVDFQVEDVSNAMIQFARNYSPFRVNTLDGSRTMGFGMGKSNISGK